LKGGDVHKIINEKGCLVAGEEWLERNLLVVAGIAVGVAFLQVPSLSAACLCLSVP
jgi:tetraspanin-5